MADTRLDLAVVDGLLLPERYRTALRPGETLRDAQGRKRVLPRYLYEVPSWNAALELELTPHFALWEFLQVDVREIEAMRVFPRYVPCAVTLLAVCLERFREAVGTLVHIATNGGYRTPAHQLTRHASPHCWATAADVYRIGDAYMDDEQAIGKYQEIARATLPGVWTRPFGPPPDFAQDHLHLDFGYVLSVPRDIPGAGIAEPGAGIAADDDSRSRRLERNLTAGEGG
jgi:hypothetical protein